VRTTNSLRDAQSYVPDQIGEGLALPVGKQDEQGHQTFLKGFGLPYEEALGPVNPTNLGETLRNVLSETNPLIKGLVEKGTGINTYSGRPLGNRMGLLDYTPLSRISSTANALTRDPIGAGLHLASPVTLQEANVPNSQRAAIHEAISKLLEGNPNVRQYLDISVPKDKRAMLSPQEQLLLQVFQSLNQPPKKRV
jgi:hypothetical protein